MALIAQQFSKQVKDNVSIGRDLSSEGLIWRKLADGTGTWRYDFTIDGTRYKGTIGPEKHGITFSIARAELEKIRLNAQLGKLEKKNAGFGEKTFSEVAVLYLADSRITHKSHWDNESRLRTHLQPFFGDVILSDVTVARVEALKAALICKGLSNATINRIIYLLSGIFEYAIKHDDSLNNPVRKLKKLHEDIGQIVVFTDAEVASLFEATGDNTTYQAMVGLGVYAGMRAGEVLGLDWKDVNFEKNTICVCQSAIEGRLNRTTKSNKMRYAPLTPRLKTILTNHRQATGSEGLVVKGKGGEPLHHVQKIFGQLRRKAGVRDELSFHDLRHTFATNATNRRVDVPTVQKWLGHSDIKTTMRYVHVDAEHLQRMMALLDSQIRI